MAIQATAASQHACNNLHRVIKGKKEEIRPVDQIIRQLEREIPDLTRQARDPGVDADIRSRIKKDLPELNLTKSKAEAEIRKLRQELQEMENQFAIDCAY